MVKGTDGYMKKHILAVTFIVVLLIVAVVSLYYNLQPKSAPAASAAMRLAPSSDTHINDFETRPNGIYYLWLNSDNKDSQYVLEYVIEPLLNEIKKDSLPNVESITISDEEITNAALNKKWGVYSYPTFLKLEVTDNKVSVLSALQWKSDDPYDSQDLKKWLHDNGIWPGVYTISDNGN